MKKRVLKLVSMMLIAVMTVGATAGCGSTDSDAASEADSASTTEIASDDAAQADSAEATDDGDYADTITIVWYPNESADTYTDVREEVARLITEATGKEVEQKLTTDYTIAIESIANGTAQIGCCFGAEGYIEAKEANDSVNPLFVQSDSNGTLDEAMYYSFFAVNEADAAEYETSDGFSIDNIQGKSISFVSDSSTSGFKVPTNNIISHFSDTTEWADLTVDDLLEGGSDKFFSEVLFGGSHQGSAYNLLSGNCDVAAFCDLELAPYVTLKSGEEHTAGAVYEINEDADAPFDQVTGATYEVISASPVMNGPFVYNGDTLSPEDVAAIQELFTSDEVTNDSLIFYDEDSDVTGMYAKDGDIQFVTVDDSWYDPIREME